MLINSGNVDILQQNTPTFILILFINQWLFSRVFNCQTVLLYVLSHPKHKTEQALACSCVVNEPKTVQPRNLSSIEH